MRRLRFAAVSLLSLLSMVPSMPARIHLDSTPSRAFQLNPRDKDHPRMLTFNARSQSELRGSMACLRHATEATDLTSIPTTSVCYK